MAGLSPEMMVVLAILALTLYLLVSEVVRVDVAALTSLLLLGLSGVVPPQRLFVGFSSSAVITIAAVMVMAAGLDRTGVMNQVAAWILRVGGGVERRVVPLVAAAVSVASSVMPNIGAAALFLPVTSRISTRTGIPLSRLLMPMGFCAILGGTLTMIGNGPLIMLNDLMQHAAAGARDLPSPGHFGLLAVTPLGLVLTIAGIAYFHFLGRRLLPRVRGGAPDPGATARYFEEIYGIRGDIFEMRVPPGSPLVGRRIREVEVEPEAPFILGVRVDNSVRLEPPGDDIIGAGNVFALMGPEQEIRAFRRDHGLDLRRNMESFIEVLNPARSGIAELVVPPGSNFAGRTIREIGMRRRYAANVLAIYREEAVLRKERITDTPLRAGDTLVVHSRWQDLQQLARNKNILIVTDFPREITRPHKVGAALSVFVLALGLVIAGGLELSLAMSIGAAGMVLTGVLKMDEAYRAIGWQTVFLLACLLPLGASVESTGLAAWTADHALSLLGGMPVWVVQAGLAVVTTFLTMVISNIGATVVLVPVAMRLAVGTGADPAVFALIVALAASNSFLLPTHQVNALVLGPAGYRVRDFVRAGAPMTLIYLVVLVVGMNVFF